MTRKAEIISEIYSFAPDDVLFVEIDLLLAERSSNLALTLHSVQLTEKVPKFLQFIYALFESVAMFKLQAGFMIQVPLLFTL